MHSTVFLLAAILGIAQDVKPDKPRVPSDSVELVVVGCLTGRALKASEARQVDVERGPDVRGRTFRLASKGKVTDDIKREHGHLVEVTGIVKRSALDEDGVKLGRRVTLGGGPPVAGSSRPPSAAANVDVMDATLVRWRANSCSG